MVFTADSFHQMSETFIIQQNLFVFIMTFNTFMLDHTLHCTVEENIFVVIVYKLLLQKKY